MASTYSSNLRLELVGTGEQQGVWGATTNVNLGQLLEQAIGGYQEVTMGNSNYTLTALNGALDESRNAVIKMISSVDLSATRNVVCPNIEKTYYIKNATSGGQSILFKTAGGTGVTIPNGAIATVYVDGTNVVEVSQTPNTIASGGTGATTASQARYNLGLGSMAIQNASSVAVTGGSIDAAAITNGTIAGAAITGGSVSSLATDIAIADGGTGASTAAGARTNLELGTMATQDADDVVITGGVISGLDVALPVASGGTGLTTGITGLVKGTGTAYTAAVAGTDYLSSNETITLSGAVTGSGSTSITTTLSNTAVTPGDYTNANITVDSTGRITAASNGSAGGGGVTSFSAGTTGLTPSTGTTGAVTLSGTLAIANGGTGATTQSAAANAILPSQTGNSGKYLTTNGTAVSWATVSGGGSGTVTSVAVSGGTTGLTTSGGPITSSGTITIAGTLALANGGTGATSASGARSSLGLGSAATQNTGTSGATLPFCNGANTWASTQTFDGMVDCNNSGEALTISTGSGYFTIGSASAISTSRIRIGGVGATSQTGQGAIESICSATATRYHFITQTSGSHSGSLTTTSNALAITNPSDYRLKTNIEPMTGSMERVTQLNPKTYNWKQYPDEPKIEGFIAHELQAVVPLAVHGEKDAVDENGNVVAQTVDIMRLIPLLTSALKDSILKINQLEQRIAALEAKV